MIAERVCGELGRFGAARIRVGPSLFPALTGERGTYHDSVRDGASNVPEATVLSSDSVPLPIFRLLEGIMQTTVGIPTYGRPADLDRLLVGLPDGSVTPDEVLVVNGGDGAETAAVVDTHRSAVDADADVRIRYVPFSRTRARSCRSASARATAADASVDPSSTTITSNASYSCARIVRNVSRTVVISL